MDIDFELYIYALFGLVLIASIVYKFFFSPAAIIKRKLRKTLVRKISLFQNGEVAKVVGTIKYIGTPLVAPLSGRACAYYHVLVEQKRGRSWNTLIDEEMAGNVVIKDGNHYALVETGTVKSYLVADQQYQSDFLEDERDPLFEYLLKHGHNIETLGRSNAIRYEEGILEEGEIIAVSGKGTWKRKSEVKLEIPVEKILVIGPDDLMPVYFTDDPAAVKSFEIQ